MLVLSRKRGERIRIDGPCELLVVDFDHSRVRIGFEGDKSTTILRSELIERDARNRQREECVAK